MSCHSEKKSNAAFDNELKVLLMGNPNVGKSVIFSKLTGMNVIASNYTGTTVSFTKGEININGRKATLIDVPGVYSLKSTSKAEEVAVSILENENADAIICVIDATNLERNLYLALELKEKNIPMVFAVNLSDVAANQGIEIDIEALEEELAAPVIPTIAIRNKGLREILNKVSEAIYSNKKTDEEREKLTEDELWKRSEDIAKKVQKIRESDPTFLEKMGDLMLKPFPGIPIAFLVIALMLGVVVGGGKALRGGILLPIINNLYAPFVKSLVSKFVSEGILYNILVGEFGVLIKGIEWPFALVLPYVFLFYVALSFLEDSGYLPRLGVLVDGILKRIGLNGGNIIPIIMGYGCAVPAILGSRAATTKKERIIIASIVSLSVPCVAQTGAFISLLGEQSVLALIAVYLISFFAMFVSGVIAKKLIPGKSDPILLEIPNLLMPDIKALLKKISIRTKHFMIEAEIPMVIAIVFAALVVETGVLNAAAGFIEPFVGGWLGLPKEATLGLILGVLRREFAVLPLLELNLSTIQLLVASVVALFYLPCLSVFAVLIKEFGVKTALIISSFTFVTALVVGGLINQISNIISLLL
ncbi:MAG TPA: ferrous iron transporter B [Ruminiclostridium sp.]|jgi:ferrous iron transport protein B|uniref:Ferrous iron transport protein B n=1 Tax=Acetivibrio saccincola TaxID=1677857 RepID=A0A2K9E8T9_9FIRM|nr:ferrous iron transporter B [Acetivibrio saccincola]AUG58006.1 Ferrous iron transport protein B [Acetivibrio saccincola]NLW28205.1 ferrous iron transporter B [Acetivibrio saccincola]HAA43732.1 ferrous iron transporter B [Ruminiclostridium sp.]